MEVVFTFDYPLSSTSLLYIDNLMLVRSPPNEIGTQPGTDVTVEPSVTLPDGSSATSVSLTFDSVQSSGTTIVTAASVPNGDATQSPSDFKIGQPPVPIRRQHYGLFYG